MFFTGEEARKWGEEGKIAEWIQHFLRCEEGEHPNPNFGLADGLLLEERFYTVPMLFPLGVLNTVRVAKDLTDEKELASFRRRVDSILQDLPGWNMPPFLAQFRDGGLYLTDGNHRYTALQESGATHGWAIVWGTKYLETEAMAYLAEIAAD